MSLYLKLGSLDCNVGIQGESLSREGGFISVWEEAVVVVTGKTGFFFLRIECLIPGVYYVMKLTMYF